ncbi:MAG TPA: hypothetical protein VFZ38_15400 [Vicinamibacterales bacterium]
MLTTLWRASAPLTVTAFGMLAVLALTALGLALDPRLVTGAPVWLKPAKFALSISIYAFTLAWIFTFLGAWRRTRRVVGWTTAVVMALEMGIIGVQAYRGTSSHFNASTPLDMALFSVMGLAIVVQTITTIAVAVALWRQRFDDVALGWALRLGMTMTIVGAFAGGLMTAPTSQQLTAAKAGEGMPIAGAHTVGAPDGGPGMTGTGWSSEHGDLRVPHFIGLHALQAIPMVALVLRRRKVSAAVAVQLVAISAASYAALFGIVLMQALRGQSLLMPDALTLTLLASWLLTTAAAMAAAVAVHSGWLFEVKPGKIAGA